VEGLLDGAESIADLPPEKVELLKEVFDDLVTPFASFFVESPTGVCRARRTSGVVASASVTSPTGLRGRVSGQAHLRSGGLGLSQSVAGPADLHGCVPTLRMTTTEKTKRTTAPRPHPATHLAYARQVFDRVIPSTSGRSPCSTAITRPSPRHGGTRWRKRLHLQCAPHQHLPHHHAPSRHLHVLCARRLQHPPLWRQWIMRGVGPGEAHELQRRCPSPVGTSRRRRLSLCCPRARSPRAGPWPSRRSPTTCGPSHGGPGHAPRRRAPAQDARGEPLRGGGGYASPGCDQEAWGRGRGRRRGGGQGRRAAQHLHTRRRVVWLAVPTLALCCRRRLQACQVCLFRLCVSVQVQFCRSHCHFGGIRKSCTTQDNWNKEANIFLSDRSS
jgi:hypothetical protein